MNKVFQTGKTDCLRACVSTVLGIPVSGIPNFCSKYSKNKWYKEFKKWCHEIGVAPICNEFLGFDWYKSVIGNIPWIAHCTLENGVNHFVVMIGNKLYHNPKQGSVVKISKINTSMVFVKERYY